MEHDTSLYISCLDHFRYDLISTWWFIPLYLLSTSITLLSCMLLCSAVISSHSTLQRFVVTYIFWLLVKVSQVRWAPPCMCGNWGRGRVIVWCIWTVVAKRDTPVKIHPMQDYCIYCFSNRTLLVSSVCSVVFILRLWTRNERHRAGNGKSVNYTSQHAVRKHWDNGGTNAVTWMWELGLAKQHETRTETAEMKILWLFLFVYIISSTKQTIYV